MAEELAGRLLAYESTDQFLESRRPDSGSVSPLEWLVASSRRSSLSARDLHCELATVRRSLGDAGHPDRIVELLRVMHEVCERRSLLLDGLYGAMFVSISEYIEALIRQCAAQVLEDQKPESLRRRHLTMILAIARLMDPVPPKLPAQIVWRFLRCPWELAVFSKSGICAFSLQSGEQVHQRRFSDEAMSPWVLALLLRSRRTLPGAPLFIGTRFEGERPRRLQDLSVHQWEFFTPFFWHVRVGARIRVACPDTTPAAYMSDALVVDRLDGSKMFRAGCVAVLASLDCVVCWVGRHSTLLLCDMLSGECHELRTTDEPEDPATWDCFNLMVEGCFVLAAYSDALTVFEVARNGVGALSFSKSSCGFQLEVTYCHVYALAACNGYAATLLQPTVFDETPEEINTISRVDVHRLVAGVGLGDHPVQQIHGAFWNDVAVADDVVLTLTAETAPHPFMIQAWSIAGDAHCLWRVSCLDFAPSLLVVTPRGQSAALAHIA